MCFFVLLLNMYIDCCGSTVGRAVVYHTGNWGLGLRRGTQWYFFVLNVSHLIKCFLKRSCKSLFYCLIFIEYKKVGISS